MERHAVAFGELSRLAVLASRLRDPNPGRDGVTQLEHALQCGTRAEHAFADAELVAVAFAHDLAKPLSEIRHGEIIAEILREYVSDERYQVLRTHGEFQADRVGAAARYLDEPWCTDAMRLHAWDSASFQPGAETLPLDHFLVRLSSLMHH
jgi:predicted HD phosphohydrolase